MLDKELKRKATERFLAAAITGILASDPGRELAATVVAAKARECAEAAVKELEKIT
jgi:hypothetical protein